MAGTSLWGRRRNCSHQNLHEGTGLFAILKECAQQKNLYEGSRVHIAILKRGLLEKSPYVANSLVAMYAKCGAFDKAQQVLDELAVRDVVSWNALVAGYAQHGHGQEALDCFEKMQGDGVLPDIVTLTCILKACGSIGAAEKGERFHAEIVRQGLLGKSVVLGTAVVAMYAKCGALAKAQQVLDELPARDIVSWNALITGYTQHGHDEEAVNCFERMQCEGLSPNAATFACVLKATSSIGAVDKGEKFHAEIVRRGLLQKNSGLGTALVDMYGKCGALARAQQMLDELPTRNVASWSALIAAYAQHGYGEEALNCFEKMQRESLPPDVVTFACILKACSIIGAIDKGEKIHAEIFRRGLLEKSIVLGTALVAMYAKCGAPLKAQEVFDKLPVRDVVSWSTLIAGYAQQGHGEQALECFEQMRREGVSPNAITFSCILKACGSLGAIEKGEKIHGEIVRQGLLGKNIELGTALVDMYGKCGALEKAQQVFDDLPIENAKYWNALIGGYAQHGHAEEALKCYKQMKRKGFCPDDITFACILKVCGSIGAADEGERIDSEIVRQGLLGLNIVVGNALVDMYAKCGAIAKAAHVLNELAIRNIVTWNALITGYAQNGLGQEALNCFEQMQHEGVSPDAVTLQGVLNACSHSGLLDEGQRHFAKMRAVYDMIPDSEHYTCMVDLFGRAGHFDKAVAVIKKMPSSDCLLVWVALLSSCQLWGNVKLGRLCFEHALQLDENFDAAYVCMSNIYVAADKQEEANKIEGMKVNHEAWQNQGVD